MPAAVTSTLDDLDLEAMKALIRAQHEQLSSPASEIAHLKLLLDKLQRMLFGARSEKLVRQVTQLELQLEELETSRGEEEVSALVPLQMEMEEEPRQPSRRTLSEHLPREEMKMWPE
jgi:transposase